MRAIAIRAGEVALGITESALTAKAPKAPRTVVPAGDDSDAGDKTPNGRWAEWAGEVAAAFTAAGTPTIKYTAAELAKAGLGPSAWSRPAKWGPKRTAGRSLAAVGLQGELKDGVVTISKA